MNKEIGIICAGKMSGLTKADLTGVAVFEDAKMAVAGEIAAALEADGAKAIIGSAGNCSEIQKYVSIPVIVAYLTYFDVLESLKEVESTLKIMHGKLALIMHASNLFDIERLYPFLQNEISFFSYQNEEDLETTIRMLLTRDYEVLVGGPTAFEYARRLGMKAHNLAFGRETMLAALTKARDILKLTRHDREQRQRLKTVIDFFPDGIIETDRHGIITMCNPRALSLLKMAEGDIVGKDVGQVTGDKAWKEVYETGVKQTDVLMEINRGRGFSTRQPIVENGRIIGSVGTLQDVAKIQKLEHKYRSIQTLGLVAQYRFEDIIGDSPAIKETIERAKAFADFDSTILIEGETGTGKEIFAQSIHTAGLRSMGPFVAINCATLSETLLESELLGYEEGAFTGAKRGGKIGLFELAHKGTIFLDEINQIPLQLQSKVLRVIQEKVVLRVGGEKVIPVDVRIIAATNENLKRKIAEGKFRDDLYYRVNVLNLRLPPLRDRTEDVPALIRHFLKLFAKVHGVETCVNAELMQATSGYEWPGNVRELANYVERYAVLSQQSARLNLRLEQELQLERGSAPATNQSADSLTLQVNTLENMEMQIIKKMVERCKGNKLQAALLLNISRSTLWNKMRNM